MNVLVVSQYYYPEPFRINEICEELVRRRNKVTVITANPNYPDGEIYAGYRNENREEIINGVSVYRCKCRPRYSGIVNLTRNYIDFVLKVNKQIEKIKGEFDCIYMYQLSPITSCLPAIKLKKKKNIPIFLYCLDVWPESLRGSILGNPIGMKIIGVISRYIYKSADKLAVTSPAFEKYISKLCNIDINSIQYIPQHSTDIKQMMNNNISKRDKVVNFVFMGNIGEVQNLECLLKAVALIDDRRKFKIHIVGSGSYYKKCVRLASDLAITDTVIFYGRYPKTELSRFYEMADVCYASLKDEGIVGSTIPGKIQEYMSAGKPILACMNGDTADLIKEAECGLCVPANDENELSVAIIKMVSSEMDLKTIGNNSRKYFTKYFTLSAHADRLEVELDKLIKNN